MLISKIDFLTSESESEIILRKKCDLWKRQLLSFSGDNEPGKIKKGGLQIKILKTIGISWRKLFVLKIWSWKSEKYEEEMPLKFIKNL